MFERQIATAKALLDKNGALVTYQQVSDPAPNDPAQPWKVGTADTATDPAPVSVRMVFVRAQSRDSQGMTSEYIRGTNVTSGYKKGLLANHGFTPKVNDRITHPSGDVYTVAKIESIQPADAVILWKLELAV